MSRTLFSLALALVLGTGALVAADQAIQSGPQVGQDLPGPFHPLNINGDSAGKKNCLYCQFGSDPVAMIFAREASPAVVALAKKLEAATGKNADLNACVIFCNDDATLTKKLEETCTQANLKKVILAVDNPAGPDKYKVAKDADVTVLLYTDRTVKANFAFKKGELTEKAIETVVADLGKILPKK
jgi:hypothetical protein